MPQNIYPNLNLGHDYRLKVISDNKKVLQNEIEQRRKLRNTYKKIYNGFDGLSVSASLICLGAGVSGVALLATVVAAPVCIVLEGIALSGGLLAIISSIANRKIIKKLEKHEKICAIAISKLNSISNLVSKALEDGRIEDVEFKLVVDEYDKYVELRNKIRKNARDELAADKIDMESLKKELAKELLSKL